MTDADDLRWIEELREHLLPAIEVLNARGEPLLPVGRGDTAGRLRRAVAPQIDPGLDTALRGASAGRAPIFLHLDGLRLAAQVVHTHAGATLVILLGERLDSGRDAARRAELGRIAAWLAHTLARSSDGSGSDPVRAWHEVSVLHRMLTRAIATGSIDAVMHAYVEALAIWADIDTRAYVGDRAGHFTVAVALAGADAAAAPLVIPADAVATLARPTRLDPLASQRFGFAMPASPLVAPLRHEQGAAWLLVYLGAGSIQQEERLATFHDLLLPAIRAAGEVEASRLMWSMMQQLMPLRARAREPVPLPAYEAAADALAELEQAGLCTAAMLVLRRGGETILELGTPVPEGPGGGPWPAPSVQVFTLSVPVPFAASLTLWRPIDRPFTGREARLGAIGASVLASWTTTALLKGDLTTVTPGSGAGDRRQGDAATRADASLIVIRPVADAVPSAMREMWVTEIRRRLRSTDVAGALSSGEISLLLPGTGATRAEAVATRLRGLFRHHAALTLLDGAPVGIATGRPPATDGYSVLRAARDDADAQASDASPTP